MLGPRSMREFFFTAGTADEGHDLLHILISNFFLASDEERYLLGLHHGGVGRACAVGRGLGVTLGVGVGLAVGVTVGVEIGIAVGLGVGVRPDCAQYLPPVSK